MKIQEVIDRVLTDSTGEIRIAPTCDQLMTGDPQQEVKGIAVTFMATVEVIREAAAKGVNFIITHEPTWFTGRDVPDWCAEDSTYLAKRRLIDETGMTIWRYHDHMHAAAGDRIYWGVADKLGWNQYLVPGQKAPWLYEIPQTTLVDLAADLKRKLDMTTLQTIGDPEMPVNKVLVLETIDPLKAPYFLADAGHGANPRRCDAVWGCDRMDHLCVHPGCHAAGAEQGHDQTWP